MKRDARLARGLHLTTHCSAYIFRHIREVYLLPCSFQARVNQRFASAAQTSKAHDLYLRYGFSPALETLSSESIGATRTAPLTSSCSVGVPSKQATNIIFQMYISTRYRGRRDICSFFQSRHLNVYSLFHFLFLFLEWSHNAQGIETLTIALQTSTDMQPPRDSPMTKTGRFANPSTLLSCRLLQESEHFSMLGIQIYI